MSAEPQQYFTLPGGIRVQVDPLNVLIPETADSFKYRQQILVQHSILLTGVESLTNNDKLSALWDLYPYGEPTNLKGLGFEDGYMTYPGDLPEPPLLRIWREESGEDMYVYPGAMLLSLENGKLVCSGRMD